MTGKIKMLKSGFNWGFVTPDVGKDIFFHASGLSDGTEFDSLEVGMRVAFDAQQSERGPICANLTITEGLQ